MVNSFCQNTGVAKIRFVLASAILLTMTLMSCSDNERILMAYYPDGSLKSKWIYQTDTLNGTKLMFWKNRRLAASFEYRHGKRNGKYELFYNTGFPAERGESRDNLRHGVVLKYFASDSLRLQSECYFVNVQNKEYLYYQKDFNRDGIQVADDRPLKFSRTRSGDLMIQNLDHERCDSIQLVVGDYDVNFILNSNTSVDTIRLIDNKTLVRSDNRWATSDTLRGQVIAFANMERGDTVVLMTKVTYFEERIKGGRP